MTKTDTLLRHFFNRHPDLRNAALTGVVNRRALAKLIIKEGNLSKHSLDAVITGLRRFEFEAVAHRPQLDFNEVKVQTKDHLAIIELDKTEHNLQRLEKLFSAVRPYQGQTLKIVVGASIKLFLDDTNVERMKELFEGKVLVKTGVAELVLQFPEKAGQTPGIAAYVTAELSTEKINLMEVLSCTPELLLYVDVKDLLRAYETIQRMRQQS